MVALNAGEFQVVASATTAQDALDAVKSADVDVALIGATLADGPLVASGTEADS